jgi:peroxiredoxin Q/BCP
MIGSLAPDFTLQDERGTMRSLSDWRGGWVILYFYPKDATPGCTLEAEEWRDHEYELSDMSATVIGVSADSVDSHREFCRGLSLNFTLLSDPDGEVCRLYDVWREKNVFGAKMHGIERTTFVIDPAGIVRKVYGRVKPLGHTDEVIADLRNLQK